MTKLSFSAKIRVMEKKNILIIFFLILLLAGVGIFYFYLKNIKVNQDIISYVPENAIFYAELDLQNKELKNFYAQNFRGKTRLELLLKNSNFFGKLSKYLINKSNKISLVIVEMENKLNKIWIINSDNIHELHALMPKGFNVSILNSKTIVLSENKDVLKLIKKINESEEKSKPIPVSELHKKIAKNFSNKNFFNIYFNAQYFKNKINSDDVIFPLILNNLNLDFNEPAFLNLKAEQNKIVYNFNALAKEKTDIKKFNITENLGQLVNLENKDIFATFFVSNLKDTFEFLTLDFLISEQKKVWEKKYNLDEKKIREITDYSAIFLAQSRNDRLDNKDVLDLDKYNYAFILKTNNNTEKVNEYKEYIKQLIKNIVAFKNPIEKIKKLPDDSESIELIADVNSIDFVSENNLEILDTKNFNFVLTINENNLIFGNSKKLIEQIEQKSSMQSKEPTCEFLTGSEALIMNTNKLTSGVLSFADKLILNFEQKGKKINLQGCLLW